MVCKLYWFVSKNHHIPMINAVSVLWYGHWIGLCSRSKMTLLVQLGTLLSLLKSIKRTEHMGGFFWIVIFYGYSKKTQNTQNNQSKTQIFTPFPKQNYNERATHWPQRPVLLTTYSLCAMFSSPYTTLIQENPECGVSAEPPWSLCIAEDGICLPSCIARCVA